MTYKLPSGKVVILKDDVIKRSMKVLGLTKDEAIQMYLEDEGELENKEQNDLDKKAKKYSHAVHDVDKVPKRGKVHRSVSDEKKTLFEKILENLKENYDNVEVLNENKLIQVVINGISFKIDLVQSRPPKK